MKYIIKNDKEILKKEIEDYINIIKKEFPNYVDLPIFYDLNKIIHITKTNTVSLFVRDKEFYFPIEIYDILEEYKKNPKYGIDTGHKTYTRETLLINNNSFYDYIDHILLSGLTPLEYFEEILLHEVLHFCGSGGANALREGINEYLTRIIALKYDLKTNGCAYPKELKVVLELEKIIGLDALTQISFAKNKIGIANILSAYGSDAINLFFEIEKIMQEEFLDKYYNLNFPGTKGPFIKAKKYEDIDYSRAFRLLEKHFKSR